MKNTLEEFKKAWPKDRSKMKSLVGSAKDILVSAEINAQQENLRQGKKVLDKELSKDAKLVIEEFGDIFKDIELAKKFFSVILEKLKWEDSKIRAMVEVLAHALYEFYFNTDMLSVDEHEKKVGMNPTEEAILHIISSDYGAEVMMEVKPLVSFCLQKVSETLGEKKGLDE